VEKTISTTNSAIVFLALGIQHAMRMRCGILSSVACPALHYFSTLSHKRHDLKKNIIEHKIYVLIFPQIVWTISHTNKNLTR